VVGVAPLNRRANEGEGGCLFDEIDISSNRTNGRWDGRTGLTSRGRRGAARTAWLWEGIRRCIVPRHALASSSIDSRLQFLNHLLAERRRSRFALHRLGILGFGVPAFLRHQGIVSHRPGVT